MQQAKELCGTAIRAGDAILMARFLDRDRRPLDPSTIGSITYSIYCFNPYRRDVRRIEAGYDRVTLNVGEVIYDSLKTGGLWAVDDIGYNFCHRIRFSDFEKALPQPDRHYEVRYVVTQTTGETTVVGFRLRVI